MPNFTTLILTAARLQAKFPSLLNPSQRFDVAISNRIRTNQTAHAFMQGLHVPSGKMFPLSLQCPNHSKFPNQTFC